MAPPAAHAAAPKAYYWPTETHWARVSIVLLVLSIIQCFTSAYVYQALDRSFAVGYLAYALLALVMMVFRCKHGLLFFGLGGLTYACWLCALIYHSIQLKDYVRVCLEFVLLTFEALVFVIAIARYHEAGGFTVCCGPPSKDWKGRLLVGGGGGGEERSSRLRASSLMDAGNLDGQDEPEQDRLHATLLANQYHASAYAVPQPQHPPHSSSLSRPVGGSPPSDSSSSSVEPASHVSPVSESYMSEMGRGEIVYQQMAVQQQLPAAQRQQTQLRSNFSPHQ